MKKYIFLNNLHIFHTNWNKNFIKLCDLVGVSGNNSISNGIVIDIGGGSSEFVSFEKNNVVSAKSFPIGSLNMYKRYVKNMVPSKAEISEIKKEGKKHLMSENNENFKQAYGVGKHKSSFKTL